MHIYLFEARAVAAEILERRVLVPFPPRESANHHSAWLDFRMADAPQALPVGSLIEYRLRWHGLPIHWPTEITEWNPPHRFVDRELRGPYALWSHEHWFEPHDGGTRMNDRVTYSLPLGILGKLAHAIAVQRDVEKIFDFAPRPCDAFFPPKGGCTIAGLLQAAQDFGGY
jgi:ligand-binding SRPBCC domain-containing protein